MRKENKEIIIDQLAAQLEQTPNFYITDVTGLNAKKTAKLRRECFDAGIKMVVVKNTLLRKAIEKVGYEEAKNLFTLLEGSTAVLFTDAINAPAKLLKNYAKEQSKPSLKGAYVQECAYVGENQLDTLVAIKSREELIGDIIGLILSPGQRLVSAITSSGNNIAGIVKAISERE